MHGVRTTTIAASLALLVAATAADATRNQHDLDALAFMAGCWRSEPNARGTIIEERYTPPAANLMLGTTRYLRGDSVVSFEFTRIEQKDGRVALHPYPNGEASVAFALTAAAQASASFENPTHDFPTKILYRRSGDATLVARIEGPDGRGQEWTMKAFDCVDR